MKGYFILGLLALLAALGAACAQSEPALTPTSRSTTDLAQSSRPTSVPVGASRPTPRPTLVRMLNPVPELSTETPLSLRPTPNPNFSLTHTIVENDYLGFDIVALDGAYYAIPQDEGGFQLQKFQTGQYSTTFAGESVEGLKRLIGSSLAPTLAEEGYIGFNIVRLADRYFAIPQEEGSFGYDKYLAGGYARSATGDLLEDVKEGIDGLPPVDWTLDPTLVVEGYLGFNILQLGDQYYGISQEVGSFEYDEFITGSYERGVTGSSLGQAKEEIDGLPPAEETLVPILVVEGYRGYNILQLGIRYYGTLQGEGAFDLPKYQAGVYGRAVDGGTLKEVKEQIRELVSART